MSALIIIASIIIGFLIGSIPSSYIVGRLWGKVNLLEQGESHVSATAIYREVGLVPFIIAILGDLIKGMLAIYISHVITGGNIWVVMATAVAATAGHCWSVFIKFHGGLGAVIIFGMLFYTGIYYGKTHIPWEFAIGGVAAIITMLTVRNSTLSTILWAAVISVILLIELIAFNIGTLAMVLLPLLLLGVQIAKLKLTRRREGDVYKNNLFSDLRRVNRPFSK